MAADFTRPERAQAFAEARRLREQIAEAGGCAYCTRRGSMFAGIGRHSFCGLTPPRQFPKCVGQAGGFEFDEEVKHG